MENLKSLIAEVAAAESRGVHFHCGFGGRSRSTTQPATAKVGFYTKHNAKAVWNQAITDCLPKCKGDRKRAVQMVNRQNPGLREAMVQGANPTAPVARSTTAPRAYRSCKADVDQMVTELVDAGMSRQRAVSQVFRNIPGLRESLVESANEPQRRARR